MTSHGAARTGILSAAGALCLTMVGCSDGDWEPAFAETAPANRFSDVAIAKPAEALTLARVQDHGVFRLIGVTAYRDGQVEGVDLTVAMGAAAHDPITVFENLGYDGWRKLIEESPATSRTTVAAERLVAPVSLRDHHIAAATNFPEHAGDAGVEDGPFLFAKMVAPTGPHDPVSAGDRLLDYEVEVAWVTLGPWRRGELPEFVGLVACNDFTDRATLLRHIDPSNVVSGDGFTTGKSFPGSLPIGNLFVIPRDHRRFVAALDLRLYVDRALRQDSGAKEMIWDLDEVIAQTWGRYDQRWEHLGQQVSLFGGGDVIPARTLLLSGTPHGTIFDGLRLRHYLGGLGRWLFGGWSETVPANVVAAYIDDAQSSGAYLKPGQRVEIHVDRLGVLRNQVAP